jgi:CMP/dCMP kinase
VNQRVPSTMVITIDGPAAAGKSTVARLLARRLGFLLLDSGALYRGLALHLLRRNVSPASGLVPDETLASLDLVIQPEVASMRVFLDREDVTEALREEALGVAASRFSTQPSVRNALLALQRSAGGRWNLVAEGRDMGTVVFPDARAKFFLRADLEERSRRRYRELSEKGQQPDFREVLSEMHERDLRDETRAIAPLVQAADAIAVDATRLFPEAVVELMLEVIERLKSAHCRANGLSKA